MGRHGGLRSRWIPSCPWVPDGGPAHSPDCGDREQAIMRELIYAMCFTGRATPVGSAGGVFTAATTAPSSRLASTVGPDGLTGGLSPAQGGTATFASEVTCTSEAGFQEVGTITFGAGNVVRFSTVGSGHLRASADPTRKHGAVLWRVDGGDGQF